MAEELQKKACLKIASYQQTLCLTIVRYGCNGVTMSFGVNYLAPSIYVLRYYAINEKADAPNYKSYSQHKLR